jgi:hypothetical protein
MSQLILNTLEEIAEGDIKDECKVQSGYNCTVCGFLMEHPPTNFNICPSCGTEFGNDDLDWTIGQLRQAWLDNGAQWWSTSKPAPEGWNAVEQVLPLLISIPKNVEEITTVADPMIFELAPGQWSAWKSIGAAGKNTCRV